MVRKSYHTQEKRKTQLIEPIKCINEYAWLGEGWYFWVTEDDALFWGNVKKRKTGEFVIYSCDIDCENVLDTVFNEKHYYYWIKTIEKVAKNILQKTGLKPSLKDLNDYIRAHGVWDDVDGIMFQDISENPIHFMVKEFQYKKRIQIALYAKNKISKFAHHYTGVCT